MNINQIKYFITLAKCLNFNKAADQLYITQPALSRQISSMESELNIQLFIRTNKKVILTPAGILLRDKFENIYNEYNSTIEKAKNINRGLTGYINIGILDGMKPSETFVRTINYFNEFHQNVEINILNFSFNEIIERLYDGRLDVALTLYFEVEQRTNLNYLITDKSCDHIVVSSSHKLAKQDNASLSDLKDETFIMVSPEDSSISAPLIINACKKEGFMPKVRYAPNLQAVMLLVEAGIGVAILDSRNRLTESASVKFLNLNGEPISNPSSSFVWHQDNSNSALKTFIDIFMMQKS